MALIQKSPSRWTDSLVLGDDILLLVRATPQSVNNNDGFVILHSSEAQNKDNRPEFKLYHTNISSLNITTTSTVFDADNSYTFDVQATDYNGVAVTGGLPRRPNRVEQHHWNNSRNRINHCRA